jgi:Amt family ammonium transporter
MQKLTIKQAAPFIVLMAVSIGAIFIPPLPNFNDGGKYSAADIAWIIVATALVFPYDAGPRLFLRRYGSQEKRDLYHDQKPGSSRGG